MASEECARPLPPSPPPPPSPPLPPKLLNDSYCDHVEHGQCFSFFSQLPAEIRLSIWRIDLQRNRIIGITLQHQNEVDGGDSELDYGPSPSSRPSPRPPNASPFYSETNRLGNLVSGKDYYLALSPHHRLSRLLRVNAEARAVALSFYRLQLPCGSPNSSRLSQHGHHRRVYINPEFDFVHVQLGPGKKHRGGGVTDRPPPPPELLADFLHDCRAYDPRGRGVLNLIVGNGNADKFRLPHDPHLVAPQALEAFKSTITNLQSLFFYIRMKSARTMTSELIAERIRYNRGVPIESPSEGIVILGDDPRRIEHDLDLVCVGIDPRASLWVWREMERKFNIVGSRADARFLLTCQVFSRGHDILTCSHAKKCVQEESRWQSLFYKETGPFRGMDNPDKPEQIADAVHAVGFWLLGLDAFGAMPERAGFFGPHTPYLWDMKHDANLITHRPQLGLFALNP